MSIDIFLIFYYSYVCRLKLVVKHKNDVTDKTLNYTIMNKKLILLSLIVFSTISVFSQDSKIYHSFKYGMFTEYYISPTGVESVYVTSEYNSSTGNYEDVVEYEYGQRTAYSIINFVYTFRFNLLEPSENFGLGINASPSLGLSYSDNGLGSFNIPAYLSLNFGAGSTYSTGSNMGGYVGIGFEYSKMDIISLGDDDESLNGFDIEEPKTSWAEPMIIAGVRWWSSSNRLMEVSFKYGFGSNGDLPATVPESAIGTPKTFQLTYGWFINY